MTLAFQPCQPKHSWAWRNRMERLLVWLISIDLMRLEFWDVDRHIMCVCDDVSAMIEMLSRFDHQNRNLCVILWNVVYSSSVLFWFLRKQTTLWFINLNWYLNGKKDSLLTWLSLCYCWSLKFLFLLLNALGFSASAIASKQTYTYATPHVRTEPNFTCTRTHVPHTNDRERKKTDHTTNHIQADRSNM